MATSEKSSVQLVALCLERFEEGGAEAVDALLAEHPEHADDVRERIAMLHDAGLLDRAGSEEGAFPERLGPFRLIERLGGGGMGVVYLADEETLGRRVALKLVRPDLLYFDSARERFQREVEVVARMKHPGIVPVYTAGEEQGLPYYTMEYVEGPSLEQVVRALRDRDPARLDGRDLLRLIGGDAQAATLESGRPFADAPWVDVCLHLALQLARVLEHAHGQGVLHRDLKPSNIMLAPGGRVMLLDFGLASTRGTSKLTRTGSQVGSLPYMAPEQLRGEEVDERTDLYSLGVTLYELLTLRLPYLARDPEVTRRRILEGAATRVREENPAVSWDAETVCLVAIERDRARRYAGARALADDLSAALQRRPIAARRPGPLLRARRFVQRHPARSVGAALGALLLVGSLGFGLREYRNGLALAEANAGKDVALADAEAGFRRALEATNEMLRRVASSKLQDVPGGEELSRDLLTSAVDLYEELLVTRPDDVELRCEAAMGFAWLAFIRNQMGDIDGAAVASDRALELVRPLYEEWPHDARVLETLGFALSERHHLLENVGDVGGGLEVEREQLALETETLILLQQGDTSPKELRKARYRLAGARLNLGVSFGRLQRLEESARELEEARRLVAELLEDELDSENTGYLLLACCANLGALYTERGEFEEATEVCGEALEVFRRIDAIDPRPNYRNMVIGALRNLSDARIHLDDDEGAIAASAEALELSAGLAEQFPAVVDYRVSHVRSVYFHAHAVRRKDRGRAHGLFEEAVDLGEELVRDHPGFLAAHEQLAGARRWLTRALLDAGRLEEAEALARENLADVGRMLERWTEVDAARSDRPLIVTQLAEALLLLDRLTEAREHAEEGASVRAGVASAGTWMRESLAWQWSVLARIASAQGDRERALAACERVAELPADEEDLRTAAGVLAREGEREGALDFLERALAAGFDDVDDLQTSKDWEALRRDARFAELLVRAGPPGPGSEP